MESLFNEDPGRDLCIRIKLSEISKRIFLDSNDGFALNFESDCETLTSEFYQCHWGPSLHLCLAELSYNKYWQCEDFDVSNFLWHEHN